MAPHRRREVEMDYGLRRPHRRGASAPRGASGGGGGESTGC